MNINFSVFQSVIIAIKQLEHKIIQGTSILMNQSILILQKYNSCL
jgi:hypothetical protein